jgi:hypothetical protein
MQDICLLCIPKRKKKMTFEAEIPEAFEKVAQQ